MKYKLLKETPWAAEGAIIEFKQYRDGKDYSSETYDWMSWHIKNHPEYFEEVKETLEPRWKVGDKVININNDTCTEIFSVSKSSNPRIYNYIYTSTGYFGILERDLRDPTPEELITYFK